MKFVFALLTSLKFIKIFNFSYYLTRNYPPRRLCYKKIDSKSIQGSANEKWLDLKYLVKSTNVYLLQVQLRNNHRK